MKTKKLTWWVTAIALTVTAQGFAVAFQRLQPNGNIVTVVPGGGGHVRTVQSPTGTTIKQSSGLCRSGICSVNGSAPFARPAGAWYPGKRK